jgi:hypothetical protein
MRRLSIAALVLMLLGVACYAQATDNPTGTWKWTMQGRNNQTREVTLKLKLEGDALTGAMVGRNGQETPIQDGTYKDGDLSFKVVRKGRSGQEMTSKYSGKVSGDTIKGKIEFEINGQSRSRDWEAKRAS